MRQISIAVLLVILGFGFLLPSYSQALTIGPPIFEFSADPGDVVTDVIMLRNEQDQTMTFYSTFETFAVRGPTSGPQFSGKREDLALWIEIAPSVTLAPKQGISVPFTIRVPETADPGSHSAAIFLGTAPAEGITGGVGIVSRLAVLVFLNVSGEVTESAEISNFSAGKNLFTHLPISFSFHFLNTGTVHLKPQGEIIVKNLLGKTTAILPVSSEGFIVLPKNEMDISATWQSESKIEGKGFFSALKKELADLHLGYYKANLSLEIGSKPEAVQKTLGFWIIPWRTLLLGLLILALLLLGITKGLKLYNRWIIAKARKTPKKRR